MVCRVCKRHEIAICMTSNLSVYNDEKIVERAVNFINYLNYISAGIPRKSIVLADELQSIWRILKDQH